MSTQTLKPQRCAAQVFGAWVCDPRALQGYVEMVKGGKVQPSVQDEPPETETDRDEGSPGAYLYQTINGIAVIQVRGPITKYSHSYMDALGGTSSVRTRQAIRAAVRDSAVKAILMIFDTPGGTVSGTGDAADDISAARQQKPVYAYCEDMCASGGYWLASQCQRIYANPTALVGCLGGICIVYDTSGAYEKEGTIVYAIPSDGAETYKGEGLDGVKVTPAHQEDFKREINELTDHFKAAVQAGRGFSAEKMLSVFDGRSFVGDNAKQLGLIDEVASVDAAIQAISLEVQQMNQDDFTKYAAEHPEAVKTVAAGLVTAARDEGRTEGAKAERDRFDALCAINGVTAEFVRDQFKAGADVATARSALADQVLAENAKLKDELAEAKKNPPQQQTTERSPQPLTFVPNPPNADAAKEGLDEGKRFQQMQLHARGLN